MNRKEYFDRVKVGDIIEIESSCISLPSMGGYPDYVWRTLEICEDGYTLNSKCGDMAELRYNEDLHIEKGGFR